MTRRCEILAKKQDEVRTEFNIGRGRGQAGFRTSRKLWSTAKRRKGGGKAQKTPELGFELFQWLVDTVDNLKCRVYGWMLMMQARIIIKDIERFAEDQGVPADIPAIEGTGWLSRWRKEWGVVYRAVTLVYKVSWANLLTRVGIDLRNNIRLRTLWRCFFGDRPFKVLTCDQKPFWFNSNGSAGRGSCVVRLSTGVRRNEISINEPMSINISVVLMNSRTSS